MPKRTRRQQQSQSRSRQRRDQQLEITLPTRIEIGENGVLEFKMPHFQIAINAEEYLSQLSDITQTKRLNRTQILEVISQSRGQPLIISYRKILTQNHLATVLSDLETIQIRTSREANNLATSLLETPKDTIICCFRKEVPMGYFLVQTFPGGEFKQINTRGIDSVILGGVEYLVK